MAASPAVASVAKPTAPAAHTPAMVFTMPRPPQPLRLQSARVFGSAAAHQFQALSSGSAGGATSSSLTSCPASVLFTTTPHACGPLFRPQPSSPQSSRSAACSPAAPTFPVEVIPNGLAAGHSHLHVVATEPFFWKADDPMYAPVTDCGPKYDPVYTLVRPRVRSASLHRTAARLSLVQHTAEQQSVKDRVDMRANAVAVARRERESQALLDAAALQASRRALSPNEGDAAAAAGEPGGNTSPRTGAIAPPPPGKQPSKASEYARIAARLESARKHLAKSSIATTYYAPHTGGHWADGMVTSGSSLMGHVALADRTIHARLPVYRLDRPLEFLQASPRGGSFSKTDRFPSPRGHGGSGGGGGSAAGGGGSAAGGKKPRREAVSMRSAQNMEDSMMRKMSNA